MAFKKRIRRAAKRVVRRRPRGKYPAVPRKNTSIALIKKVMTRMAEKKIQTYYTSGQSPAQFTSSTAAYNANIYPMTPYLGAWTISQGTGQGGRVGNKVRTHSAMLDINITPQAYNATTNANPRPSFVRIWFIRSKQFPLDYPAISSICGVNANFLQIGNTNQGLTGTFQDLQLHVNRDAFNLLMYKTYKIGFEHYSGTGQALDEGQLSNNDFKLCILKRINLTKIMPKILNFDDTTATADSPGVFMLVQTVTSNGVAVATNYAPIRFAFSLTYTYTDD